MDRLSVHVHAQIYTFVVRSENARCQISVGTHVIKIALRVLSPQRAERVAHTPRDDTRS